MHRGRRTILLLLLLVAFPLAGCGQQAVEAAREEPAELEPVDGSTISRIRLSEKAAERLDIQTATVRETEVEGRPRTVIPYAAVFWDANGDTWTYTSPEPLVFVREPITLERIDGDEAILLDGPRAGTDVVAVGVAELFGVETGVGGSSGH